MVFPEGDWPKGREHSGDHGRATMVTELTGKHEGRNAGRADKRKQEVAVKSGFGLYWVLRVLGF